MRVRRFDRAVVTGYDEGELGAGEKVVVGRAKENRMEENSNEYSDEYSEQGFWEKLKKYAMNAGRDVVEKTLVLYYCLLDADTPAKAKAVIVSALGYFIVPIDVTVSKSV